MWQDRELCLHKLEMRLFGKTMPNFTPETLNKPGETSPSDRDGPIAEVQVEAVEPPDIPRRPFSPKTKLDKKPLWSNLLVALAAIVVILACAVWIFSLRINSVVSNSMAPLLQGDGAEGDRVLCWMWPLPRELPRWDIAVFAGPAIPAADRAGTGTPGSDTDLTIKRIVGLGGERLVIRNGDIWTATAADQRYRRAVKPDWVQRPLWIGVYAEDFTDPDLEAFRHFWREDGAGEMRIREGLLHLDPGAGGKRLTYKALARSGQFGELELELPGIPDRYVLDQEVIFHCRNAACGQYFPCRADNQKIIGRCPACRTMNYETRVVRYGSRSGLPEVGPDAIGDLPQGDPLHFRLAPFYYVPDLRLRLELRPDSAATDCQILLAGAGSGAVLQLSAAGMRVNGKTVPGVDFALDKWTGLEFYRVDGVVRLFVNGATAPVFEADLGPGEMEEARHPGLPSGVALNVAGAGLAVRSLSLDRDVHYLTVAETGVITIPDALAADGGVEIPRGTFLPLGDNTPLSLDGRSWGPLPWGTLRGFALYLASPKERAKWVGFKRPLSLGF